MFVEMHRTSISPSVRRAMCRLRGRSTSQYYYVPLRSRSADESGISESTHIALLTERPTNRASRIYTHRAVDEARTDGHLGSIHIALLTKRGRMGVSDR